MNNCDEYAVKTLRYLDHGLEAQELKAFLLHLESCSGCRKRLLQEKELSATLHRSHPLYSAPATLRSRVSAAVAHASPSSSAGRPWRYFLHRISGCLQGFAGLRVLAPAAIALVLCLTFVPSVSRNVRAASYVEAAVAEHRSYLDGTLLLGLRSSSPELVTVWFADKVPFDFRLPVAEPNPERKPAYRLTGSAVVSYQGHPAALVTYEMHNEKISLLAISNSSAVVAGGDEVRFRGLTFHYRNDAGFRVITWSDHGLSYALVSSVSGPPEGSCLVCHQNMADRGNFAVHP